MPMDKRHGWSARSVDWEPLPGVSTAANVATVTDVSWEAECETLAGGDWTLTEKPG